MKANAERIEGGVLAAKGFSAGAAYCGLKTASDALDIAVLVSDRPAAASAVYSQNQVVGAPIIVDRHRLPSAGIRGLVVNSGNANDCTGESGVRNAERMCSLAAGQFNVPEETFVVSSTGIIGVPLPMAKIRRGIKMACEAIGKSREHEDAFARAIMTTDTRTKQYAVKLKLGGAEVYIGGAAKGSGMIAPNMATMLCYVTTDADLCLSDLSKMVRRVADRSFNCITVEGHTSPSDTLLVMANGASGVKVRGKELVSFESALEEVCVDLSKQMVGDGEGATKLVTVNVTGTHTDALAKTVAMAIANSPLVKTAIHGGDPNWGRIVTAAGNVGVPFEDVDVELLISGVKAFSRGRPLTRNEARLAERMKLSEIVLDLRIGKGPGKATVWTCDFSREYITINADYHT